MSQHDGDTPMGDPTQDPPGSVGGASRLREERLRANFGDRLGRVTIQSSEES